MEDILNVNARAVLDTLRANPNHPTAQEVYDAVRLTRPRIGLATVYRVLRQLTEQGIIRELVYGTESARYDARTHRHDHAVCTVCGALLDVPIDIAVPPTALQDAAQATRFELGSHEVRIYGRCQSCQARASDYDIEKQGTGNHEH